MGLTIRVITRSSAAVVTMVTSIHVECHSVVEKQVEMITVSKMIIMQVCRYWVGQVAKSNFYVSWKTLAKPALGRCAKGPVACNGHELKRLFGYDNN